MKPSLGRPSTLAVLVFWISMVALVDESFAEDEFHKSDFGWYVTTDPSQAAPCAATLAGDGIWTTLFVNASGRLEFVSLWWNKRQARAALERAGAGKRRPPMASLESVSERSNRVGIPKNGKF